MERLPCVSKAYCVSEANSTLSGGEAAQKKSDQWCVTHMSSGFFLPSDETPFHLSVNLIPPFPIL